MNGELALDNRYERLYRLELPRFGVEVFVCVDSTVLGPALGGTRFKMYDSADEAKTDAIRLGRGMTYKAAMLWESGYHLGGGKQVIFGDPETQKSPELFLAIGDFIDRLGGEYITAEDMNTDVDDMTIIATKTNYVVGCSTAGGSSGNPAPYTAMGCLAAIRAALAHRFNSPDVKGRTFIFQGAGEVGFRLARLLKEAGARIIASDVKPRQVERIQHEVGASIVEPEKIHEQSGDVFVPCAMGGILNDETIPALKCSIVSGPANNQLADPERHGTMLMERDITYTVDFIGNAGGLIAAADELLPGRHFNEQRVKRNIQRIALRVARNLELARSEKRSPYEIAIQTCDRLIEGMRALKQEHAAF